MARKMIDLGVPVALSTDCNPGSSPTVSLPFIMNLGCLKMGMTPAEVITAATINAAHAINRGREIGSLEVGKKADVTIFKCRKLYETSILLWCESYKYRGEKWKGSRQGRSIN